MKINPYSLLRPKAETETRIFTDPSQPGLSIEVTLKPIMGFNAFLLLQKKEAKLKEDFVTGVVVIENGQPVTKSAPAPLVFPTGEVFKPTEMLCSCIAQLMMMEVPSEGESPSDFMGWCAFSEGLTQAFGQIYNWSNEINDRAAGELKNVPRADTETSSALP